MLTENQFFYLRKKIIAALIGNSWIILYLNYSLFIGYELGKDQGSEKGKPLNNK